MESSAEEGTEFPRPPLEFTDRAGHDIRITAYDGGPDPLAEMYLDYDDDSRAQGLPPRGEAQIREWLDDLLAEGLSVAAWHEARVVGHAVLFPYDETAEWPSSSTPSTRPSASGHGSSGSCWGTARPTGSATSGWQSSGRTSSR